MIVDDMTDRDIMETLIIDGKGLSPNKVRQLCVLVFEAGVNTGMTKQIKLFNKMAEEIK